MTSIVDYYFIYQFVRRLATPLTKWPAYNLGVIDNRGRILVSPDKRTEEQKRSLGMFDVLVLNLKKLLAYVPGGGSTIGSLAAAYLLLKEGDKINFYTEEEILEKWMDMYMLIEDAPANSVGGGAIAGVGVTLPGAPTNWGEPGVDMKRKKRVILQSMHRRKLPIGVGI